MSPVLLYLNVTDCCVLLSSPQLTRDVSVRYCFRPETARLRRGRGLDETTNRQTLRLVLVRIFDARSLVLTQKVDSLAFFAVERGSPKPRPCTQIHGLTSWSNRRCSPKKLVRRGLIARPRGQRAVRIPQKVPKSAHQPAGAPARYVMLSASTSPFPGNKRGPYQIKAGREPGWRRSRVTDLGHRRGNDSPPDR
jgi:hypothetical protein